MVANSKPRTANSKQQTANREPRISNSKPQKTTQPIHLSAKNIIFALMKTCHVCHTPLPDNARFCYNCGAAQTFTPKNSARRLDLRGNVPQQIIEQFFLAFRQRIEDEHQPAQMDAYSHRLYESGFQEVVIRRAEQIAEQIASMEPEEREDDLVVGLLLENVFEDLLDYFIIHHCQDINQVKLPEAILSYQGLHWEEVNLFQMVMHYLDFANEEETVFTDFLEMPIEKLKNASQSFLFPEKKERIFFICDQSILGSVREGFAMTEKSIYWKAHLEKARQVQYGNLRTIERKKDWITINDHFFNVNQSINLKMLKLLKKIKRLKLEP